MRCHPRGVWVAMPPARTRSQAGPGLALAIVFGLALVIVVAAGYLMLPPL